MKTLTIKTAQKMSMIEITAQLEAYVEETKTTNGLIYCFVPHTTAGVTINENADKTVTQDMLYGLEKIVPDDNVFQHLEGNSAAHIKASLIGASESLIIKDGTLVLGIWQGVYLCEFDGPRTRNVYLTIQKH